MNQDQHGSQGDWLAWASRDPKDQVVYKRNRSYKSGLLTYETSIQMVVPKDLAIGVGLSTV